MINFTRFLLPLLLGLPQIIYAQKEGNNWYFGDKAGITFNSGSPTALTDGQMSALEGCASISTKDGRLLFYTNGMSVWDSTHTITPNGYNTLNGSYNSTQAAIIIPHPGSSGQYYIFTTDFQGGSKGLCYSEFDMSLNSDKGDVVVATQNIQLLTSTCEKLTAVKHANGRDYWVLALDFGADTLYSYLITPAGLSKTVKFNTGLKLIIPWAGGTLGYMKASPDGSKIAYNTCTKDTLMLADFNASTGEVSNMWRTYLKNGYGLEFSAKSNYLYAAEHVNFVICQFNARAKSQSDFTASKIKIDSTKGINSPLSGSLQLGPDGKIYTCWAYSYYLGVIHAPDSAGKACRPQQNYIYLKGRRTLYGLPGFIQSYLDRNQQVRFTRNCIKDSTFLWPSVTKDLDSVKWDFGDTASGNKNRSRSLKNAYHVYNSVGIYKVKLVSLFKTYRDSTFMSIHIKDPKPFIGNDTMFCNAFSLTLKPRKNYLRCRWNTGDTLKTITIKSQGTYILSVKDSLNCYVSDTILIKNPLITAKFNSIDTSACQNYNIFQFKNSSVFKDDSLKSLFWKISDNTSYTDTVLKKSFGSSGSFSIKLIITSKNGCIDSLAKKVVVHPNSATGFSINKPEQCFKGHDFIFKDTSKVSSGIISSYFWNLGDGKTDIVKTISSKKYSIDSAYKITLVTNTDKGCRDTLSKMIIVYPNPVSAYSVNQVVQCFKYNSFDFNNSGSIKKGAIISYAWDLGDSKSASTKNVIKKNYASADSFTVTLLCISDKGCRDSISKKMHVNPNSDIDFSINRQEQCFKGHDFVFTNQSTISGGTISNAWDFGDGNISSTKDISSKKYGIDSIFKVRLITTTDKGCRDTLSKTVSLHPNPVAAFGINKAAQCLKWNSFDFSNTSGVKTGIITGNNWTLGDGDRRGSINVQEKHYTAGDSFKVDLLVISEYGCRNSISQWIRIRKMDAGFDIFKDSTSCPLYIFSNTSTNYKTLKWNLGDPGLDEKQNTRHEPEFNHRFSQLGTFTPCLFIENINGCTDTVCSELIVNVSKKLNIPNVFTPGNNDKLNDAFDIETLGMEEYHLEIYNRWGQKLFVTDIDGVGDDSNNWRGRPNSVSNLYPDGTYFYILNYKFKCEDTVKEAHGVITLIGGKQ